MFSIGKHWGSMGKMKKRSLSKILLSVVEAAVVVSLLFTFWLIFKNAGRQGTVYDITEGWDIKIDETLFTNASINEFRFTRDLDSNIEELTMSRMLSEDMLHDSTLRVYDRLCAMEVYFDDELIYEVKPEEGKVNPYMGMGYYFVTIPNYRGNHLLTIHFKSLEKGAISSVPDLELTSTQTAYSTFVDENVFGIFTSVFLVVLGLIITIVSLAYTYLNNDYFRLFLIGVFSFMVGMWCMCSHKIMLLLGTPIAMNSSMEFFLMELSFLPLLGYNIKIRENLTENQKNTIRSTMIINIVFNLIVGSLHYSNMVHYPQTVLFFYILAAFDCAVMLFVGVNDINKMNKGEKIYHYALACVSLAGFWLIFEYINGNYISRGIPRMSNILTPVALIVFVIALLVSYAVHLYDEVLSKSQQDTLASMVYKDALTGLFNRLECEEIFKKLDKKEQPNYLFIDFDLNGLKKLNDEKGHAAGDLLISSFGKVLLESFSEYGKSMRMGGDEFLTIIEGKNIPTENELMAIYFKNLEKYKKETGLEIDAAYGIAGSSEIYEPKSEQVFRIADERMYEMKRLSKKGRRV